MPTTATTDAVIDTAVGNGFDLKSIVRPNIWNLEAYRCARDDFSEGILLDANENSYGPVTGIVAGDHGLQPATDPQTNPLQLHRYPDPLGRSVKQRLLKLRQGIRSPDQIFLGVGSDEVIDLLVRILCVPGQDEILITPPTYGMYKVVAAVNDVGVVRVPLDVEDGRFQLQVDKMLEAIALHPNTKLVWLCSPGNPTATRLETRDIERILNSGYRGVVVVDEAYIDFASYEEDLSLAPLVNKYPNLVVMQTLSKGFGLAGIRLGVAFADPRLVEILNKTKAPYNVSSLTLKVAEGSLDDKSIANMRRTIAHLIKLRDEYLVPELLKLPRVGGIVGTSSANFVLARIVDKDGNPDNELAHHIYNDMASNHSIVVRYRGNELGCEGCLRITVGTEYENQCLIAKLRELLSKAVDK
ncbi:histidinol-phosphate transaminase [Spiromyces aspiralis]|uniref:Histidinol-phosphate transaminase n=1 Tax=Spiromyces aspiralis TaxID=68401 RepID=A0ACC1HE71_9FUNG|nr:histidinol-phosphate transaminase [Spiromyces aspiralis]